MKINRRSFLRFLGIGSAAAVAAPVLAKAIAKNKPVAWYPKITPAQQAIFESPSRFIIVHSKRGSGKTKASLTNPVIQPMTPDDLDRLGRIAYDGIRALTG